MAFNEYFLSQIPDQEPQETQEWLEALEQIAKTDGEQRARYLINEIIHRANSLNIGLPPLINTDYVNTIPPEEEPEFPGDEAMEKRIRRIIRWNAVAMVQRANKNFEGIGGHLSTYASSASLYEVGFNHFFRGPDHPGGGDQIFIQGHGAPGIYARAFLEGRLSEEQLDHFRRETSGKGLSSYPHPWLMDDFWQFPTVSMGLGGLAAIYQARYNQYLTNRNIKDTSDQNVWAFLGDGEMDEPESTGALSLASREKLGNLKFVINCNLQRLDGPVRGNGKVIQELERIFKGAGWHVIKVIWGPEWNDLLNKDDKGLLVKKMNETPDGQFQKYTVETGEFIRNDFFAGPELSEMVSHLSDEELKKLRRGGHSYRKVYSAFKAATSITDRPVVILCKTVKGWTLGEGFQGVNVTHQLKKLNLEQLKKFRDTLELPIKDDDLEKAPYFHPGENSEEVKYLKERRKTLGGSLPQRRHEKAKFPAPNKDKFKEFLAGGKAGVAFSTTMAFVRLLKVLLRDGELGKHVVPIVPDEARTFGMESLFREIGIYSSVGQLYTPVDSNMFLNYHEAKDGQLIEEGITEAGSMATFTAAGTAHATHGVHTIPFYIFYSMFGLQRTADQAWAFGDARGRGFLMGATAGRTTLNGEGLQHEDGHSHFHSHVFPNMLSYDPAYAYELSIIIQEGLRRMITEDEDVFYYITLYNENYPMPPAPKSLGTKKLEEGVLKGIYLFEENKKSEIQLFGSGPILGEVQKAAAILKEQYKIESNIWSVTSYQQLYRDGRSCDRYNRLHPEKKAAVSYLEETLSKHKGPIVATSDWISEHHQLVQTYVGDKAFVSLGTNGFGRSDTREALREHFEISPNWIVYTVLGALYKDGNKKVTKTVLTKAKKSLGIDVEKLDPMYL